MSFSLERKVERIARYHNGMMMVQNIQLRLNLVRRYSYMFRHDKSYSLKYVIL